MADYPGGKEDWVSNGLPVEGDDVPHRAVDNAQSVPACHLDAPAVEVAQHLTAAPRCAVVNHEGVVMGTIEGPIDVEEVGDQTAADLMKPAPSTFRPGVTVAELTEYLQKHGDDGALLTTNEGKLVGWFALGDD